MAFRSDALLRHGARVRARASSPPPLLPLCSLRLAVVFARRVPSAFRRRSRRSEFFGDFVGARRERSANRDDEDERRRSRVVRECCAKSSAIDTRNREVSSSSLFHNLNIRPRSGIARRVPSVCSFRWSRRSRIFSRFPFSA